MVLHQSPDLPLGGEYVGHEQYSEWAAAMSSYFDQLEIKNPRFFEDGNTVAVVCRFITRSRTKGTVLDFPMVQVVTTASGKITDFGPFYWIVPEYKAATD